VLPPWCGRREGHLEAKGNEFVTTSSFNEMEALVTALSGEALTEQLGMLITRTWAQMVVATGNYSSRF